MHRVFKSHLKLLTILYELVLIVKIRLKIEQFNEISFTNKFLVFRGLLIVFRCFIFVFSLEKSHTYILIVCFYLFINLYNY